MFPPSDEVRAPKLYSPSDSFKSPTSFINGFQPCVNHFNFHNESDANNIDRNGTYVVKHVNGDANDVTNKNVFFRNGHDVNKNGDKKNKSGETTPDVCNRNGFFGNRNCVFGRSPEVNNKNIKSPTSNFSLRSPISNTLFLNLLNRNNSAGMKNKVVEKKNCNNINRSATVGRPVNYNCSRRYAEVGRWKNRGDAFLEPYMQGLGINDMHVPAPLPGPTAMVKRRSLDRDPETSCSDVEPPRSRTSSLGADPLDSSASASARTPPEFRLIRLHNSSSQNTLNEVTSCDSSIVSSDVDDEEADGEGDGDNDEETPCDITLLERLIRSHPVWFLPGIQRAGAFHLLQGKEDGNFVVRQSSQSGTMAISVRLPPGKGPYIEHYLIQSTEDGKMGLESSDNRFESIPALIAHYSQCCDELPVQLTLPQTIREAKNRQQLSSLALLGQEFWRYPMANPKPEIMASPEPVSSKSPPPNLELGPQHSITSCESNSHSHSSSLSSIGSGNNNHLSSSPTLDQHHESVVLNLSPLSDQSQPNSLMSTFKGSPPSSERMLAVSASSPVSSSQNSIALPLPSRAPRPTPPNTLNLISCSSSMFSGSKSISNNFLAQSTKTPPPPPPRWAKPTITTLTQQSFSVTTTLTFNVNSQTSPASSPNNEVHSLQAGPLDCESLPSLHSLQSTLGHKPVHKQSQDNQILSPMSDTGGAKHHHHRRSKRHKQSRHYQESDILESPTVYYRSSVADKSSDYEDIWGEKEGALSTFKPMPPIKSGPFTPMSEPTPVLDQKLISPPPDIIGNTQDVISGSLTRNKLGLVINTSSAASSPVSSPVTKEPQTPVSEEAATPDQTNAETPKQGSPFYMEPADAIKQAAMLRRRPRPPSNHLPSSKHRHSDPPALHQWPSVIAAGGNLERIESKEEIPNLSSSVDNLAMLRHSRRGANCDRAKPKPVQPPRVLSGPAAKKKMGDTSWTVDSSWEFIGNDDEAAEKDEAKEAKFPPVDQVPKEEEALSPSPQGLTFQEIIAQRFPELRVLSQCKSGQSSLRSITSPIRPQDSFESVNLRVSAYDNVVGCINGQQPNGSSNQSQISDNDDAQTIFSEPWDSSRWENLLQKGAQNNANTISRNKSFKERLDPLLSPPRLQALVKTREAGGRGSGAAIRSYALHLAADKSTTFAQNIDNFIACTRDSREQRPQVVMRNMRQFMSGMKNYLVKHGEREFEKCVERERSKLRPNEFLNLDAILEGVMHRLVVRPLKEHLYYLFVNEYSDNGAIQLLADNIQYARTKSLSDLGIRAKIIPPSDADLETIFQYLKRLQVVDSPLEKLENLLSCISAIFNSVKYSSPENGEPVVLGADDFLPLFVWVLVQSGMVAAEIEAEYMWGLLHPSLLSGEGGYYLTTLSSAVHVLKNFTTCSEEKHSGAPLDWGIGPLSEFRSVLRIVVPDESNGSLLTKTLPVRPNMTTKDVCKIIAHKARITNPEDYGLFKLVNGEETLLKDDECPQDIKGAVTASGKHCMFAYKRMDAKIAWPKATPSE
ncbi:protein sprint [Bemisia tabaci]|uniref:protein sprint n=1 Tax=Bemisia tabaci TaxID=7038 RepID=UPI003B28C2BA